jgi:hypothetical protein
VIAVAAEEVAMASAGGRGTPHTREHVFSARRALGDMIYRYLFAIDTVAPKARNAG